MMPSTKYAKNGDVHLAYQTIGSAGRDLVYLAGQFSHLELHWDQPLYESYLRRLSSFTRLITLDMRGVGLSDRAARLPLLEDQMEDLSAVLDRVGSNRAALFGASQAGPMAILYAATFPQRVDALILYAVYASSQRRDDYPWGRDPGWVDQFLAQLDYEWGQGSFLEQMAPSLVGDSGFEKWWGRLERFSSAPGNALAYAKTHVEDDVREVLEAVSVPTLVIQRKGDIYRPAGQARYIADRIPSAEYVELEGKDHLPYAGDQDAVVDVVEEFLTGVKSQPETNRVLATVLFTDIVGSTERAAEMGDSRWHDLLEKHKRVSAQVVAHHRGKLIDTAGDGMLATFDGPARAIRCAESVRQEVSSLGMSVRVGIHTGEVETGPDGVSGIGVHIGARVAALAEAEEILVSRTVKDLVAGSGYDFADRGLYELKGVPDTWQIYAVA
jgi:class 3 adenylate cyclase